MNLQTINFGQRISDLRDRIFSPALTLDRNEWRAQIAVAYQRTFRSFLLFAAAYYALVVVLHFLSEPTEDFLVLGSLSAVTALAAVLVHRHLGKGDASFTQMELLSLTIYALIFANILVHHLVHLEVLKLIYFMLLMLAMATTGVSLRIVLPGSAICLATAILLAGQKNAEFAGMDSAELQSQVAYIALASSFIAVGLAVLMRMAIMREVRARVRTEQLHDTAKYAADFDFLTGLPNRRNFFHHLEQAFSNPQDGGQVMLGLVDLNGFKQVNDLYGHVFGDQLLANVGERILKVCGRSGFVARLGGDEFAVLIERPASDRVLRHLGSEICTAVGQSYSIAGNQVTISAAMGFARRLATTSEPTVLYEQADYALYRAKEIYGGTVEIFTASDEAKLDALKKVEHHLCLSSFEAEMHIEYQPLVRVPENRVIGFEALARWENPHLGRVSPDVFIRAAERCGIMNRLTPTLLRKALHDARNWPGNLRLSFNLSARDVVSAESIEKICQIVAESGFPGDRIDFEITETSIMTDFERVRSSLAKIRKLGAHIALDDFGVGYSNFQHLDELAVDKLKIDRRFVAHLGSKANSGRIVKTMIEMCTNLGLICVVEGVETAQELNAVMDAGGTIVQGYHFSRPIAVDRVKPFLERGANIGANSLRHSA